jgi:hypothetical protein
LLLALVLFAAATSAFEVEVVSLDGGSASRVMNNPRFRAMLMQAVQQLEHVQEERAERQELSRVGSRASTMRHVQRVTPTYRGMTQGHYVYDICAPVHYLPPAGADFDVQIALTSTSAVRGVGWAYLSSPDDVEVVTFAPTYTPTITDYNSISTAGARVALRVYSATTISSAYISLYSDNGWSSVSAGTCQLTPFSPAPMGNRAFVVPLVTVVPLFVLFLIIVFLVMICRKRHQNKKCRRTNSSPHVAYGHPLEVCSKKEPQVVYGGFSVPPPPPPANVQLYPAVPPPPYASLPPVIYASSLN